MKKHIVQKIALLLSFVMFLSFFNPSIVKASVLQQYANIFVFDDGSYLDLDNPAATPRIKGLLLVVFIKTAHASLMAKLTPLMSSAAVTFARNNMSSIVRAVRNAPNRAGVFDAVWREMIALGASNAVATSIANAVNSIIFW